MDRTEVVEHVDLVAKRVEFLEALDDAPRHKPALVDELGHSRSTVDRAVRRLEAAGYLARTDEGFHTTLAGRLAAAAHRSFLDGAAAVLDGVGVLGALPPDCDLPRTVVRESRMETFDTPARAFEATVEPLRTADRYGAYLPRLRDSRQLRLCHARVRAGMAAELLVAPPVLERLETEFPRLAADLAVADGVTVYRVDDSRAYALALSHGTESPVTVAPADDDATGVLTATTPPAVEWAEATLADLRSAATDVTDAVAALADHLDETLLGRQERRGATELADVGVERLDATTVSGRTPNEPATGWRVGFDLVDAYYGHPFERHHPPGRESATDPPGAAGKTDDAPRAVDHLVDRLAAGANTVVVGPPGTGKSTLCRQVACRWVGRDHGPVFYRATPAEVAFDRPDLLTEALDDCDGHALVVVEDGDDETTATRLAAVLERARDDPDVSVLVESRASAWPPAPADPRAADLLRSTVEEYRLGAVTHTECRDAVAAFEAATGRDVPIDGDELFETVDDGDGPGDCSLVGYLLAATTTPSPWSDATAEPTGLDADARAGYALVAPDDPDDTLALEVGLLAAVLAAARQPVTTEVLHTVAVAHYGAVPDGDDHASAHRRVEAVVDDLRGVLLFDHPDGDGLRTQHPYWAVRFLDAALADRERTAVDAFERALSALFETAVDPAVRDHVETWLGRTLDDVDRIETVAELFGVVRRYTSLVPLFGTTEFSGIELPDGCAPETRLEARAARLFGWYKYGDLDRAVSEAERLLEAVESADVDAETATRFTVQARRRLADVADDRGDPATARDHLEAGLETALAAGDRRCETWLLASLGMVELHADDYEAAERALREAERVGEPLGPCPELSATVYYLGRLHRKRGKYAAAEARFCESLEIDRECEPPPSDEAATLNALGTVAVDRGAYARAERYYRRALERQRAATNTRGVATALVNLGDLAVETDDHDTAVACFEEAMRLATDAEVAVVHGAAVGGLGRIAAARGELDAAEEYHRERMAIDDSPRTRAISTRHLGDVAAARGDHETTRDRYEAAFETLIEVDAPTRAADTALRAVETFAEEDATADARAWLARVEELVDVADLDDYREETARWGDRLASD